MGALTSKFMHIRPDLGNSKHWNCIILDPFLT